MTQQINLYEERLRPRHEWVTVQNLGRAAVLVLILIALIAAAAHVDAERKVEAAAALSRQLAAGEERLTLLNQSASQTTVSSAVTAEIDIAKAMLAARKDVMAFLDSGKLGNVSGFSDLMLGFARQGQKELWLTGFLISAGGEEIEIRGRLLDAAKLPSYVQALSREPAFRGRRFAALEMRSAHGEEPKSDGSVERKAGFGALTPAPLAPYFEFVLRSENGGSGGSGALARNEARP